MLIDDSGTAGPGPAVSGDLVGGVRDPVQPGLLLSQNGSRFAAGRPVFPVVDLVHESLACGFKLGEGGVS
jgi:hypothetical protein